MEAPRLKKRTSGQTGGGATWTGGSEWRALAAKAVVQQALTQRIHNARASKLAARKFNAGQKHPQVWPGGVPFAQLASPATGSKVVQNGYSRGLHTYQMQRIDN